MSMINHLKNNTDLFRTEDNPTKIRRKTTEKRKIKMDDDFKALFAFISDTHINAHQYHLQQRAEDILDAFERALAFLDRYDDDFPIIHGGDVFNSHSVKPSTVIRTSNIITKHGKKIYTVRGNHDGTQHRAKDNNMALNLLDEMNPYVHYIESGVVHLNLANGGTKKHPVTFAFQSYAAKRAMKKLHGLRDKIAKFRDGHTALIIHDIVEGVTPFGAQIPREPFEKYIRECGIDLVLAGHLHTKAIDGEIHLINPGSLECLDIDQADQERGFFIVGTSGQSNVLEYRWIPIETRNTEDIIIDVGDVSRKDINRILRREISNLEIERGSVVRFTVKGQTETHLPRIENNIFTEYFPDMLKIMVNNQIRFARDRKNVDGILDPEDAMKNALRELGVDDGRIDELADAMAEISVEAAERTEGWQREIRKTIKNASIAQELRKKC